MSAAIIMAPDLQGFLPRPKISSREPGSQRTRVYPNAPNPRGLWSFSELLAGIYPTLTKRRRRAEQNARERRRRAERNARGRRSHAERPAQQQSISCASTAASPPFCGGSADMV